MSALKRCNFSSCITVIVGALHIPQGAGRLRITKLTGPDNSIHKKSSMVQIVNGDQLCMARAIGVGFAKQRVIPNTEWKELKKKHKYLTNPEILAQERKVSALGFKKIKGKKSRRAETTGRPLVPEGRGTHRPTRKSVRPTGIRGGIASSNRSGGGVFGQQVYPGPGQRARRLASDLLVPGGPRRREPYPYHRQYFRFFQHPLLLRKVFSTVQRQHQTPLRDHVQKPNLYRNGRSNELPVLSYDM